MKLKFDINNEPPTQQQIDQELKFYNIRFRYGLSLAGFFSILTILGFSTLPLTRQLWGNAPFGVFIGIGILIILLTKGIQCLIEEIMWHGTRN